MLATVSCYWGQSENVVTLKIGDKCTASIIYSYRVTEFPSYQVSELPSLLNLIIFKFRKTCVIPCWCHDVFVVMLPNIIFVVSII